jgi:integrase
MPSQRFITYIRVSTQRQGVSGLGLEAQRFAVAQYLGANQSNVAGEFVEIESGRNNDRPELRKALAACRIHRATLVVVRLDRLARNAGFLLALRDSDVDFVCADMPQANRMSIGILAVVAEAESEAISVRVKAALAAAKRRGVKLGNPSMRSPEFSRKGLQSGRPGYSPPRATLPRRCPPTPPAICGGRIAKRAGLPSGERFGWHSFRRAFATEMKRAPLKDLCEMGGWRSPATVLTVYQAADEGTQREAVAARQRVALPGERVG